MNRHEADVPVVASAFGRPRPALALNDIVYNVALGSNMDGDKLRGRNTGDGKCIEPLSEGVACRVQDCQLSFQFIVCPPLEPVMAGAVLKKGAVLHGVLWKLKREDYEILAKTEGIFTDNPVYEEREVLAVPYSNHNSATHETPVRALVFALRFPAHIPECVHPSERYKGMMVRGARNANLAPEFVQALSEMPAAPPAHWAVRGFSRFAMTGLFFCYKSGTLLRLIRNFYRPLLVRVYSVREKQIRKGRTWLAKIVTAAMLALMSPFTITGLLRAVYLRRDIRKIASGE